MFQIYSSFPKPMGERRHEFWQETALCPEICAHTQAAHNNHHHNASASSFQSDNTFTDRLCACIQISPTS